MPRPRGRPKKSNTPQPKPKPKPKQKSKTKSRKRRVTEEEGWWTIREILDERVGKAGQVEYLVQWEDEIHTGESFPPSWIEEVTEGALLEWEDKKKAHQGPQEPVPSVETTETTESESANASPLTRRRPDSFDPDPRPRKKVRTELATAGSEEPVPSIVSASSVDLDAESTYSLTEDDLARLQAQRLAIVFTKPDNFDASEYQSVSNSQNSSQKVSELEENDQRVAFASHITQGTIPDSQDLSGHLWTRAEPQSPSVPEEVDQPGAPASPELGSLVPERHQTPGSPEPPERLEPEDSFVTIEQSEDVTNHNQEESPNHPCVSQESQAIQDDRLSNDNEIIEEDQKDEDSPLLEEDNQDDQDYLDDEPCQGDEDTDNSPTVLDLDNISDNWTVSNIEETTSIPGDSALIYVDSALDNQDSSYFDSAIDDQDLQIDHYTVLDSLSNNQDLGDDQVVPESELAQNQIVQKDSQPTNADDTQDIENQESANTDVSRSQDWQSLVDSSCAHTTRVSQETQSLEESQDVQEQPLNRDCSPRVIDDSRDRQASLTDHAEPQGASRVSCPEEDLNTRDDYEPEPESTAVPESSDDNRFSKPSNEAGAIPPLGSPLSSQASRPGQQPTPSSRTEESAEPPTSSEAPNHEEPIVTTAVPDVMVSSSELPIQSEPAYSVEPWKAEVLGNTPEAPAPSISPASIMANPNQSAVERMQALVNMSFGDSADSLSHSLIAQEPEMMPPGTISPAAISRSVDQVGSTHTLVFSNQGSLSSRIDESSGQEITMGQVPDEQESDVSSQSSHRYEYASPHIITLPMHASRRPYYEEIIVDHKNDIHEFGSMFTDGTDEEPSVALKDKIDKLFNRLLNICDYPQDIVGTTLERLPSPDLAKYCCDANPKFNFLFELMSALGEKETGILIVARSAELLRLLFAVTEAVGIECSAESIGKQSDYPSVTRITLALNTEEFDPYKFDVVIGFDYGFSSSSMAKQLSKENVRKPPLVLLLTTTHTIEHIALRKSQDMSTLESKNSLLASVILARRYLEDPERGYGDPHQVAEIFSNYLNGITDVVSWEPQSIPDDVLDVFVANSQSQSLPEDGLAPGNNLKRKHDDDDDEDEYSKRTRVLPLNELPVDTRDPPLTLAVRQFLESVAPRGQGRKDNDSTIEIPISQLESIREKEISGVDNNQHDEYKRQIALGQGIEADYKLVITRLDTELKGYKRTVNKIERSNRTALQDRTLFEKEKQKAETNAKAAAETAEKERAKLQKHIEELESKIAHLTASPEASKMEDMVREGQGKVDLLTKRLSNAQTTTEFFQHRYQEVDGQATELAAENKELKSRHEDLRMRASDNFRKIHEINANQQWGVLLEQIKQLTAQVKERDVLLNLATEELRTLRNGRPQTRGTSVPRSPRVPMMSPRPGRGGFTGSASRGTSPTTAPGHEGFMGPGAQFMGQQPRNGRWSHHLQD
ncbi:hypothetical protein N0V84_006229 [Fusarium piperis]|uniref:Chromo domain-containing protein n=1 Tax=Fusarium piperis TaxID=1435070 RepID=A0A9W8WCH9_9HYPO|nr:hypothetical protein N0V84_006229 [Fusarium piperis]